MQSESDYESVVNPCGCILDYHNQDWYIDALTAAKDTPTTDSSTREMVAEGIDELAEHVTREWLETYIDYSDDFAAQLRKGINDAQ